MDKTALIAALKVGVIAAAALDTSPEDIQDRVDAGKKVLRPHIAGTIKESFIRMGAGRGQECFNGPEREKAQQGLPRESGGSSHSMKRLGQEREPWGESGSAFHHVMMLDNGQEKEEDLWEGVTN